MADHHVTITQPRSGVQFVTCFLNHYGAVQHKSNPAWLECILAGMCHRAEIWQTQALMETQALFFN